MQFQSPMVFEISGQPFARIENCNIFTRTTLFGIRVDFNFQIQPIGNGAEKYMMIGLDGEVTLEVSGGSFLIGGLHSSSCEERERQLGPHHFTVSKYLEFRADEFVLLADRTHIGDVVLNFDLKLQIRDERYTSTPTGRLLVPHSEWLKLLGSSAITRFELIAIRVPVQSSHLHKPFSEAVSKIREAEREYSKGNWNAAGACCRDAWNTVLSSVPSGTPKEQRFDALIIKLTGDPRRKEFAKALIKGMHDILNKAKHLEGDLQTDREPADLKPEDALLCIHWYSTMIGFLSSL